MKKLIQLTLIIIAIASFCYGSPLVFKVKREVKTDELTEIGLFDATKYKQIRVGIITSDKSDSTPQLSKDLALLELNSAERELRRVTSLLEQGEVSRMQYDQVKDRFNKAQAIYNETTGKTSRNVKVFGVENDENILIYSSNENVRNSSILIDTPPSKVSVKVSGKGTYSLYVWATL